MNCVHLKADREDFVEQHFGVFAQPHGGRVVLGWNMPLQYYNLLGERG